MRLNVKSLKDLLMEYQYTFSRSTNDMGLTDLVEHNVNTGDSPSIRQQPRRFPLACMEEVQKEIEDWQQKELLRNLIAHGALQLS